MTNVDRYVEAVQSLLWIAEGEERERRDPEGSAEFQRAWNLHVELWDLLSQEEKEEVKNLYK